MKKILAMAAMLTMCVFGSKAQVILQDSFSYLDGVTTNVSGGLWVVHSGDGNTSFVKNQRLEVFGTRAADINRPYTNTPTSTTLYASFIVNSTNLSNSTNYFAHFQAGTTIFKGRVFAAGPGVAANTWRLGVSSTGGAGSQTIFPLDLATNVDYRVLVSYDTVGWTGTLWVDPVVPSDANIQSSDAGSAATLTSYGFRQASPNPSLQVDNLVVGNAFVDVVGPVKPAVVYYQPPAGPTTNFVGANTTISCVGGGAGTVSFQWQHAGTNLVDNGSYAGTTLNKLSLLSATTDQTGSYRCIVTSTTNSIYSSSATSAVSQVVISVAPVPPTITTQPSTNNAVYAHSTVILNVVAVGPPTLSYQWFQNNVSISDSAVFSGTGTDTLTVSDIAVANGNTGTFRVEVTNPYGTTPSSNAVISVSVPSAVSIAYLRTLVDPTTFQATNIPPTIAYQITGIVSTYTNITQGNTTSYYLQDGTAGINIFATLGQTFRPLQGDSVTFVGVLSSFSSGLELYADTTTRPYTSYIINSSGNPVYAPRNIPLNVTNAFTYAYVNTNLAGSLVTITNVYFGTNTGNVLSTTINQTMAVTNASGQSINLTFFFVDLDTAGQTLPQYASSVTGVLYGNHPNFSIGITKFSDIVAATPPAPTPVLNLATSGSTLTMTWAGSAVLQASTNVAGPYVAVPGAVSPFVTNGAASSVPNQFFRLYQAP